MKIAVIGCGNMGSGLARSLAQHHTVWIGERDEELGEAKAQELGAAAGGRTDQLPDDVEAVFVTLRWWHVDEALRDMKGLEGKILVDVTNPFNDEQGLDMEVFPDGSSGGEQMQRRAPGARVVKAWNHVYAKVIADPGVVKGTKPSVFVCSDDDDAKGVVIDLAKQIGYEPIDAGPLSSARHVEQIGHSLCELTYGVKVEPGTAFTFVRA